MLETRGSARNGSCRESALAASRCSETGALLSSRSDRRLAAASLRFLRTEAPEVRVQRAAPVERAGAQLLVVGEREEAGLGCGVDVVREEERGAREHREEADDADAEHLLLHGGDRQGDPEELEEGEPPFSGRGVGGAFSRCLVFAGLVVRGDASASALLVQRSIRCGL